MKLIAFYIALILLGKAWIQLFSLQPRVNSKVDWALYPWHGNWSRRRKTLNSNLLNPAKKLTSCHILLVQRGSKYTHHHHHHVALVARISLTLSHHSSLSFITLGRSSGQHPVSSHSCWMYVRAGRPAFARPCVGVHKSTSLMGLSLAGHCWKYTHT